ncbi:MAG TPA: ABC transporter ATP-binding protein [Mycobacteriales bacterium]|nr:ABC transporter ATP-binding protein [Mycobacteriales bacterium]
MSRRFGRAVALDGLTLDIAPGELLALLGPSGCGKTTALRILAGFESADSGAVTVDGRDIAKVPAQRRDIGMVFQSYSLFPNLTALENVSFGLRIRRQPRAARRTRAGELLEMVGLSDRSSQYPHQLSGGQQQRVALARALAIEPRVLLLDEPLSALDAQVRLQLREQIRSLQQRLGTTTLFVTHDQEEALSMADRVGVMRNGKLEQVAAPTELYNQPATGFVAEFVGTINRIPANVSGRHTIEVLGRSVRYLGEQRRVGPLDALVRPEALGLTRSADGSGIVAGKTFLGAVTRVMVLMSGDLAIRADLPSTTAAMLAIGDAVNVVLLTDEVLISDPAPGAVVDEPETVAQITRDAGVRGEHD